MRVWGVPLALLAAAGCSVGAGGGGAQAVMDAPVPRPPVRIEPAAVAKALVAAQPDWPDVRRTDCKKLRCVALTFDDGPGGPTPRLLDMLFDRQVKATFFVVGQMVDEDRGVSLRRMVDDGHELGNHSWSHAQLTGLSSAGIRSQLKRTQDIVEQLALVRMDVMRPPYGSTDSRVTTETRKLGLAQILWNVDTLDWRDRDPDVVAKRAAKAGPGSIVLMHDIHKSTVDAVPDLIHALEKRGFTFVTISELYGKRPAPGRKYTER